MLKHTINGFCKKKDVSLETKEEWMPERTKKEITKKWIELWTAAVACSEKRPVVLLSERTFRIRHWPFLLFKKLFQFSFSPSLDQWCSRSKTSFARTVFVLFGWLFLSTLTKFNFENWKLSDTFYTSIKRNNQFETSDTITLKQSLMSNQIL